MPNVRVTDAGVYVEVGGEWVRVTDAGVYVELKRTWARATDAGVYTELAGEWARVTTAGVYIELELPPPDFYAVGDGHDVAIAGLDRLDPQPRNAGIRITRRQSSHSDEAHQDDAKFTVFEYSALGSVEEYQAVMAQWGLLTALENDVTATARNEDQNWTRFNGTVRRPRMNEDVRWQSFFPRNISIYMVDLEVAG